MYVFFRNFYLPVVSKKGARPEEVDIILAPRLDDLQVSLPFAFEFCIRMSVFVSS